MMHHHGAEIGDRPPSALETYMRGKDMQKPMLGAQRRIEARIGQLLGPASAHKGGRGKTSDHDQTFDDHQLANFRLLAHAFSGNCELSSDEWRKSRRALVSLMRQRLGLIPPLKPLLESSAGLRKISAIVPPRMQPRHANRRTIGSTGKGKPGSRENRRARVAALMRRIATLPSPRMECRAG